MAEKHISFNDERSPIYLNTQGLNSSPKRLYDDVQDSYYKNHRIKLDKYDLLTPVSPPKNMPNLVAIKLPAMNTTECLPNLPQKLNHKVASQPLNQKTKKRTVLLLPQILVSDNGKNKWELLKSIGKGGCGEVYMARDLCDTNTTVAIKIIKDRKQFQCELKTMKLLNEHRFGRGYTPKLISFVRKEKALVMELFSETISTKFDKLGHKFSLKTICMIALNMMSLVRDFNAKTRMAHVDIKPSNICTGINDRELYLIDFGYSSSPLVKLPGQTGTPMFMAQNLQTLGATFPSLIDDFESIGYVIMFLTVGGKAKMPWGAMKTHKEISAAKSSENITKFCNNLQITEYAPLAETLEIYLRITRDRSTGFNENTFKMLYLGWEKVLTDCGMKNDKNYDWLDAEDSTVTLYNSSHSNKIQ